ncbi:UDP-N-acetylmuramoylalanyl-D-glutamate--2,6-diaminopimelate ligase [Fulvimarina pelagi HTCC2506]|uniref:UDP-N-acetylmuramoyl-L-alanyl-D-glutamate--2,6-diaminopimelate ligase n=1 Tax=Fulvimarina pelagi HTCC2506 TaxID=314231 RepID=Q0G682_9HYPH|nr:UDP-N-acetylmuramoyl-L-alanyl-D-glutamate--2,6-diaminopimelate ligase [Fulvimarina pelagi]EAU42832.1 UDP-N-acetylmuramoylalanyl-D-glutamate--2,6-diaminopimelate ligase [Fulvimarina pelagi HTCC2506]
MNLARLANGIAHAPDNLDKTEISGLTLDSRAVGEGFLFVAVSGSKVDGARFIEDAKAKGAVAVLTSSDAVVETDLPVIRADNPRLSAAKMAARFYEKQPETMVAVTGTAGKTSIASFLRQIWTATGLKAASIGTTGVVSPSRNDYGTLTTPDPVALAELLASLEGEGVTHASMEASSHGIDQFRLDGVRLAAGGFTNLGHDHLDYHPDLESYFTAKMGLFTRLLPKGAPAVINTDDQWSGRAIEVATGVGCDVRTVGRNGSLLALKRLEHERERQVAEVKTPDGIQRVVLPLAGEFQMSNALVAAGLAIVTGTPVKAALETLENLKGASGRLEKAGMTAGGVPVFVDYAHKPEALEHVLRAVRPFTTGRVILVMGCGGDRDKTKRPMMGEIANRLADVVIVTDDNPRSEDPAVIRSEIMAAAGEAREIGDRREAIRAAVGEARTGDTVIVAGKGHETGQMVGSINHPFSDHEEVRRAITETKA